MRRLSIILLAGLAGCAQPTGHYPSLLPRAIESESLAEPKREAPTAKPDAALDAKVAKLAGDADAAYKAFGQAAQAAEAKIAVARGTEQGSEPWLEAQTALADLDSARAPLLSALSDLETLAIDRGAAGEPPYPALDSAIKTASDNAMLADDRSAGLEAALAGG